MKNETKYYYPEYVTPQMLIKGLYLHEWILIAMIFGGLSVFFQLPGIVFGLTIDAVIFFLMVRTSSSRRNALSIIIDFTLYTLRNRVLYSKPREMIEEQSNKKKVKHKKWSKKKIRFFQDYMSFKNIQDGYIQMENESFFLFFKINANNIDLLSESDISMIHRGLSNQFDHLEVSKLKLRFIIQDAVFNIEKNISVLQHTKRTTKIQFIQQMMEELMHFMRELKEKTTKKAFYLRITVNDESEITNIQNRMLSQFKNTLDLSITCRQELKQMIAIFANGIFSDDYPDTELTLEERQEQRLFRNSKKKYENTQLPGIYEFKDMIAPTSTKFLSEEGVIGSNHIKIYAVSSYLGVTSEQNLLSEISSMKGVFTSIYLEELSTAKYKSYLTNNMKAKKSNISNEVEFMDVQQDIDTSLSSYKEIRFSKEQIYYVSTYFMLVAPTKKQLEELDEKFKLQASERGITLDTLQLKQEAGYQCCNPFGNNVLSAYVKQNIPSKSAANLYPFNEASLLDEKGLYIGNIVNSSLPVLFDPFTTHGSNKNILISGISGIGKTVLMMSLMETSLYSGAFIRNIDIEGTYSRFIEKLGGIDINLSGNNEYAINILQVRLPDELQKGLVADYISEVRHWIATYKSEWNERKLDLFERYLTKVYTDFNITNDTDLHKLQPTDYPVLSDVYKAIEKDLENKDMNANFKEDLEEMLLGLESVVKGADAKVFNRHTYLGKHDVDDIQAINFNMKDLMNAAMNKKMAQWLNVFTYISQFVNKNNHLANKILVGFDELSEILKEIYTPLLYTVSSYERRFRKYGAIFLKATQQLDDVYEASDSMKALITPLLTQSACKFIFHLGETDYQKVKHLLNLKDVELDKIKEKRTHKCLMRLGQYSYDLDVHMPLWYATVKADA